MLTNCMSHDHGEQALRQVAAHGRRVFAPTLPGFGGTAELPSGERNSVGYARWLERYVDSVGIDENCHHCRTFVRRWCCDRGRTRVLKPRVAARAGQRLGRRCLVDG